MEQQLKKIHLGIQRLQDLHQKALIEIDSLKAENSSLKSRLQEYEEKSVLAAEKKLMDGISSGTVSDEVEKKQMKLKINELVREVDKCIALLNQ